MNMMPHSKTTMATVRNVDSSKLKLDKYLVLILLVPPLRASMRMPKLASIPSRRRSRDGFWAWNGSKPAGADVGFENNGDGTMMVVDRGEAGAGLVSPLRMDTPLMVAPTLRRVTTDVVTAPLSDATLVGDSATGASERMFWSVPTWDRYGWNLICSHNEDTGTTNRAMFEHDGEPTPEFWTLRNTTRRNPSTRGLLAARTQ